MCEIEGTRNPQMIPSKSLANNQKKKAMRIKDTITSTTSVRTNLSIAASQFQKKYFLRRSLQE